MRGYDIVAKSLAAQGIQHAYGIVGVPVIELGFAIQQAGINYYGFRNEQQASYTAGYCGYLTGIPGVCLCVSGPGHTNAISGVLNAWTNSWPMILISGSSDLSQTSRQAFQQVDQTYFVKPFTKYSVRIANIQDIVYHIQKAVRLSTYGRPGPVYIDLPGDILNQQYESPIKYHSRVLPPLFYPDPIEVTNAVYALKIAKKPLVIIGKGAAYSRAEDEVRQLIDMINIPFLPTPMGKGVVPDSHELNISPARSMALRQSDVILLIGARLNWILHFGLPPRFSNDVKIIQIDIYPQQHDHNVECVARLVGDCKTAVSILSSKLKGFKCKQMQWIAKLKNKSKDNLKINAELISNNTQPMTYYNSMGTIKKYLPSEHILVGEGANTMDIGRTIFTHQKPRRKLDAGTFGTMGIGLPAIIAAQTTYPNLWTVAVIGDSAFGFSAMQCQTLTRYKMGVIIFIINNNGIFTGTQTLQGKTTQYGVTCLNPQSKYQQIASAFGGKGYDVKTVKQLQNTCLQVFKDDNKKKLCIVNVHIQPSGFRKPQQAQWLTRKQPKAKL